MAMEFSIKKWYLDAVSDCNEYYIGYWAELHWLSITIHYYSELWKTIDSLVPCSHGDFTRIEEPKQANETVTWRGSTWLSAAGPISHTFFPITCGGKVLWTCTQPRSDARITHHNQTFRGRGYAEYINLSIEPWKLPMDVLFWGRIISQHHYVVFIATEGDECQHIYYQDGLLHDEVCVIQDDFIASNSFRVDLADRATIREGRLIDSVFKSFKDLTKLPLVRTLFAEEHKWFARGKLVIGDHTEDANVIYEKVIL